MLRNIKKNVLITDLNVKIIIDPKMNRAVINGDSEYGISIQPGHVTCDEQTVEVKVFSALLFQKSKYCVMSYKGVKYNIFDFTAHC